jgi:hypothetical protein
LAWFCEQFIFPHARCSGLSVTLACFIEWWSLDIKKRNYIGRKITESLGNVTVRGEKRWKG